MESIIFDTFPHFKDFCSNEEKDGEHFISVVVPSPADAAEKLEIYIYEEEVILCFSFWHAHYSETYGNIDTLTKVIDEIFSEQLAICKYICEDEPPIEAGVFVSMLKKISELPTQNTEYYYAKEIQHTSWRGTFSRKFSAAYISKDIENMP
ncbi:MAG TPA: hypothetical protein VIZ65_07865 [Cellvibrionaceae bacterium]